MKKISMFLAPGLTLFSTPAVIMYTSVLADSVADLADRDPPDYGEIDGNDRFAATRLIKRLLRQAAREGLHISQFEFDKVVSTHNREPAPALNPS